MEPMLLAFIAKQLQKKMMGQGPPQQTKGLQRQQQLLKILQSRQQQGGQQQGPSPLAMLLSLFGGRR